jgi:hypothetical protein
MMRSKAFTPLPLALALLASAACSRSTTEADSTSIVTLSSGTSFGMCMGYCRTELVIDSMTATFTESSWPVSGLPPKTQTLTLTQVEWQRLRSRVDVSAITRMAGVHGCPDCADGGAEWIELRTAETTARVTFEFGSVLEPIAALQAEIRALRERF